MSDDATPPARLQTWDVHLPYSRVVGVSVPLTFAALAALSVALPPRFDQGVILAPAALVLWIVWWLWAYPSCSLRGTTLRVQNPVRVYVFEVSSSTKVSGSGVPRIAVGGVSVVPIVFMVAPQGIVGTFHASAGVNRGVAVAPISTQSPLHEAGSRTTPAEVLASTFRSAGNRPAELVVRWNVPAVLLTLGLIVWTVVSVVTF